MTTLYPYAERLSNIRTVEGLQNAVRTNLQARGVPADDAAVQFNVARCVRAFEYVADNEPGTIPVAEVFKDFPFDGNDKVSDERAQQAIDNAIEARIPTMTEEVLINASLVIMVWMCSVANLFPLENAGTPDAPTTEEIDYVQQLMAEGVEHWRRRREEHEAAVTQVSVDLLISLVGEEALNETIDYLKKEDVTFALASREECLQMLARVVMAAAQESVAGNLDLSCLGEWDDVPNITETDATKH